MILEKKLNSGQNLQIVINQLSVDDSGKAFCRLNEIEQTFIYRSQFNVIRYFETILCQDQNDSLLS